MYIHDYLSSKERLAELSPKKKGNWLLLVAWFGHKAIASNRTVLVDKKPVCTRNRLYGGI